MKVAEIWRYPVKTMAGEKLQRVRVGPLGIEGDRVVHVEDALGRVITSRSHPRFLSHKGTLGPDGEPLVDGRGTVRKLLPRWWTLSGPGRSWCATTALSDLTCCRCW
jgi:uncharacterized protein YcbX